MFNVIQNSADGFATSMDPDVARKVPFALTQNTFTAPKQANDISDNSTPSSEEPKKLIHLSNVEKAKLNEYVIVKVTKTEHLNEGKTLFDDMRFRISLRDYQPPSKTIFAEIRCKNVFDSVGHLFSVGNVLVLNNLTLVFTNYSKTSFFIHIDQNTGVRLATKKEIMTGKNVFETNTPIIDCLQMLNDYNYKDVKFKLKNDKVIEAHRIIVSRSSYLKNLIQKQKSKNGLVLNFSALFDFDTFEKVVKFLYDGTIENFEDWNLLKAANLLKLEKLIDICVECLKGSINENNVVKLIQEQKNEKFQQECFKVINSSKHKIELLKQLSKQELSKFIRFIEQKETIEHKIQQENDTITNHIFQLFKSNQFTDVIFISKDGMKLHAHKAIVFPLLKNIPAPKINQVELDIDGKTLKTILELIYSNDSSELPDNPDFLFEIIKEAPKLFNTENVEYLVKQKLLSILRGYKPNDIIEFCMKNKVPDNLLKECFHLIEKNSSKEQLFSLVKNLYNQIIAK